MNFKPLNEEMVNITYLLTQYLCGTSNLKKKLVYNTLINHFCLLNILN